MEGLSGRGTHMQRLFQKELERNVCTSATHPGLYLHLPKPCLHAEKYSGGEETCDNTRRNAAEGLKGKSLAAAKRDFAVRVSAELEQEMISCSSCSISKRPISRDVSATFGKMEVASQTMRTDVVLI